MIASDVSESVRRNAVIALGFLFIDRPAAFLPTAQLLLQSYNPHIRYAAALIAGIINAGTANAQLSDSLLKTMDDAEDFVAQGAAIGLGALLMETNAVNTPQVRRIGAIGRVERCVSRENHEGAAQRGLRGRQARRHRAETPGRAAGRRPAGRRRPEHGAAADGSGRTAS